VSPRLVIFDADGTLRRTLVPGQPCPHAEHEWTLIDGMQAAVSALPADVRLGVASNQDHVGYGFVSARDAHRMLVAAIESASSRRVNPDAVRCCPHRLEVACRCRKPAPGMLLDILAIYALMPSEACFVGNESVDAQAAASAGLRFIWANDFVRCGLGT